MLEFLRMRLRYIFFGVYLIFFGVYSNDLRCQTGEMSSDSVNVDKVNNSLHNLQTPLFIKQVDVKQYTPAPNRLIYNLSTNNQENITLCWKNSYAKKTTTKWFVRLQYRLSEDEDWKDVKDKRGNNVEFVSSPKRYPKNFENIVLPEECNNRDFVQVAFLIDTYGKNKVGYPDFYFKDLKITSEYDEFLGLPSTIKVYRNDDQDKYQLSDLQFNKVPLPRIYPENKRIIVESRNIRDSIAISITGTDAQYFVVSQSSIPATDTLKTISIGYFPKKEGKHKATLILNTKKLATPIRIDLEGMAAKYVDYTDNLLPESIVEGSNYSYNIPVFSNTDYQYKLEQNDKEFQPINIKFSWYRNESLLSSNTDVIKTKEYSRKLKSPVGATNLEIELRAKNNIKTTSYYFGSPKVKTMIKSGLWSDIGNWQNKDLPNKEDFVVIDKSVTAKVETDVACKMLILSDSANISINTGKMFYVANDIFYGKGAFFTIHQYLLPSKWNYISSPINQAHAVIFSLKNLQNDNDTWLMQYNTGVKSKLDDYWSDYITDPQFVLQPARGYAVYTHEPLNVKYEGLLCSSAVTIPLIFTDKDRWNLIGNPYTAPLSSKKLFDDIDGKIQGNVIMLFDRQTKVYNPIIIDDKEEVMIPSLESFFVESLEPSHDITFKRQHQYIPNGQEGKWTNNNYLNLSVSKGKDWQYCLLGMDNDSKKSFDAKDCHKMFGNSENMPDIYLKDDNDEYSVCVFPNYPAMYDIGLYVGSSTDVQINMNNLSIMPDYVQIFIEDKEDGIFHDVCKDNNVELFLSRGTTEKYRIHIIKSIDMGQDKDKSSGIFVWKDKNRVLFYSDGINSVEQIEIKRNNRSVLQADLEDNKVFPFVLDKGKYQVVLTINGMKKIVEID